jgi:hypothetical protein
VVGKALISAALVLAMLVSSPGRVVARAAAQAPAPVSVDDAKPFLGEWTLAMNGERGPGTFGVSLKAEGDKVVGEVTSEAVPAQKVTSISKTEKGLFLSYSFPYEAMTVDAVVSLMPGAEGKVAAQIDFAGGAYTMTGTATKKEKEK